jgi:hypothetical protein
VDGRARDSNANKRQIQHRFGEGHSLAGGTPSRRLLLDGDPSAEQVHELPYSFQPGASQSTLSQTGNGEGIRRKIRYLYSWQRNRCRGSGPRFTNWCETFVAVALPRLHCRMVAGEFAVVPCVRDAVYQP